MEVWKIPKGTHYNLSLSELLDHSFPSFLSISSCWELNSQRKNPQNQVSVSICFSSFGNLGSELKLELWAQKEWWWCPSPSYSTLSLSPSHSRSQPDVYRLSLSQRIGQAPEHHRRQLRGSATAIIWPQSRRRGHKLFRTHSLIIHAHRIRGRHWSHPRNCSTIVDLATTPPWRDPTPTKYRLLSALKQGKTTSSDLIPHPIPSIARSQVTAAWDHHCSPQVSLLREWL